MVEMPEYMWDDLPSDKPLSNSQAATNVPTLELVATVATAAAPAESPSPSSWRKQSFFTTPGALPERAPVPCGAVEAGACDAEPLTKRI